MLFSQHLYNICTKFCTIFAKYMFNIYTKYMFNIYTKYLQYLAIFLEYLHNTWPAFALYVCIICTAQRLHIICDIFIQYFYNICTISLQYLNNTCTIFVQYLYKICKINIHIRTIFL